MFYLAYSNIQHLSNKLFFAIEVMAWITNKLLQGIWIANKWKFVFQTFSLFRCLLFRSQLFVAGTVLYIEVWVNRIHFAVVPLGATCGCKRARGVRVRPWRHVRRWRHRVSWPTKETIFVRWLARTTSQRSKDSNATSLHATTRLEIFFISIKTLDIKKGSGLRFTKLFYHSFLS